LFRKLLPHVAMGLILGSLCALTLIVMDTAHVRAMLASASAPRLAVFGFVVAASSLFGVGASLTGFVFIRLEEDNRGR